MYSVEDSTEQIPQYNIAASLKRRVFIFPIVSAQWPGVLSVRMNLVRDKGLEDAVSLLE